MKIADLAAARALVEQREADAAMIGRLEANEPLKVLIGDGPAAGAVYLADSYLRRLRDDIVRALAGRVAVADEKRAALGVEP